MEAQRPRGPEAQRPGGLEVWRSRGLEVQVYPGLLNAAGISPSQGSEDKRTWTKKTRTKRTDSTKAAEQSASDP
ncbi:hypothetical protein EYF80_048848 [Liparis tanakae]|uniref:Uncharacterized protein n=1 Tax=Liparis tanakae TaxID=230148 RepID=A0A4Z2FJM6_9TELE|nr:hypothetical protein EYF80_048848 [Liparis tanakae]